MYTSYQVKEHVLKITVSCTAVEHSGHNLFLCLLQGQAGWSFEEPGLVEGALGPVRETGIR